jgi:hypothetical protein
MPSARSPDNALDNFPYPNPAANLPPLVFLDYHVVDLI